MAWLVWMGSGGAASDRRVALWGIVLGPFGFGHITWSVELRCSHVFGYQNYETGRMTVVIMFVSLLTVVKVGTTTIHCGPGERVVQHRWWNSTRNMM